MEESIRAKETELPTDLAKLPSLYFGFCFSLFEGRRTHKVSAQVGLKLRYVSAPVSEVESLTFTDPVPPHPILTGAVTAMWLRLFICSAYSNRLRAKTAR